MRRSQEAELMDSESLSAAELAETYRGLWATHRWLGNTATVLRLLRQEMDSKSVVNAGRVLRVLDIGCGQGVLLVEIREKLGMDLVGFELRPAPPDAPVPISCGNAATDRLPGADVALCVMTAHHLSETELIAMIRNVAQGCRRLILLDLVRHPAPLALFRLFVAPFLGHINATDGAISIRRAFTVAEMRAIVQEALYGDPGPQRPVRRVRHTVAPLLIRQVVDIAWGPIG